MTTERQIAANRENAQKSTGPRTAQGKAISSRNSARHGLYSSAPVIPRLESVTAWNYHRVTTVQSLAPANAIEDALAERIALLLWRLGRVARYEAHLGRQLNQTLTQLRLLQRHREAGRARPAYNDYHDAAPNGLAPDGREAW